MTSTAAVIFDVDGVLVDSYDAHLESWARTAKEHGVALTETDFARTFGQTSRDIIRLYWPNGEKLRDDEVRAIDDRKEALYREVVVDDFPAMDGAAELIDVFSRDGFAIAAASSGPLENVELALEKLGRRTLFGAAVTGHDVTRGKPDPQVFMLAAERLGVEPPRCVVVEDAPAGVEAAHRAGMKCIGLISTGRTRDDVAKADLIVTSLRKVTPPQVRSLMTP